MEAIALLMLLGLNYPVGKHSPQNNVRNSHQIAPDFVIELRSRTDSLAMLQEKMQEYMDSGVKLGWLFNPQDQQVEIYRQGQVKEVLSLPTQLFGESVLPEFSLQVDLFTDD